MKRYISAIILLLTVLQPLGAKSKDMVAIKASRSAHSTFAIFVDSLTYANCSTAIKAYRSALQKEKLGTFIYAANWKNPEMIKDLIKAAYDHNKLEGAVFIGDIPTVKVSGAEHLLGAIDFDGVTSDCFYEDFDLAWRFEGRDSTARNVFCYHLTERGEQRLTRDIYSARINVPEMAGADKYQILNEYLAEVVRAHSEENNLDRVMYYGGGCKRSCPTQWRQMPQVWKEYFPLAFKDSEGARFVNARAASDAKGELLALLQRPDADLMQISDCESGLSENEILKMHSTPRVLLLNGGDEAACYIFNGGRSVVARSNSVNVCADKYDDELQGMLHMGYRVGQWQQKLPYMELKLTGDPTFKFKHIDTPSDTASLRVMEIRDKTDKALSQRKSCSDELLAIFKSNKSYEVRLEALHCLSQFADENCTQALMLAFHDPYEHIQRMACIYAGAVGDPRLEPGLKWIVETQDQNVLAQQSAEKALRSFAFGKDKIAASVAPILDRKAPTSERIEAIKSLRSTPLHYNLDNYVKLVLDEDEPLDVRVCMAEALGWCNRSWQRAKIADGFKIVLSRRYSCPDSLREEMIKTLRRLYPYK